MNAIDCSQTSNPDITGIGVRLSIYIQNFLLVILVDRSWQDAPSALWTFIATNFGLTISAISQTKQGQLSFYQALQVTNLVWLGNFGTFLALASYSRHRKHAAEKRKRSGISEGAGSRRGRTHRSRSRKLTVRWLDSNVELAATCQTFLSMALTIFTWARPGAFVDGSGTSPGTCTLNYVVLFAINVHPESQSGKRMGLAVTGVLMALYSFVTLHESYSYYKQRKAHSHSPSQSDAESQSTHDPSRGKDLPPIPQVMVTPAGPESAFDGVAMLPLGSSSSLGYPVSARTIPSQLSLPIPPRMPEPSVSPAQEQRRQKRPRRVSLFPEIDPMFLGILIAQFVVFAYFITTTELLLVRNKAADNSDDQFAFGQILALILVVPSLISVVSALKEHGLGPLHHRLKVPKTRHRRGDSNASQQSQVQS